MNHLQVLVVGADAAKAGPKDAVNNDNKKLTIPSQALHGSSQIRNKRDPRNAKQARLLRLSVSSRGNASRPRQLPPLVLSPVKVRNQRKPQRMERSPRMTDLHVGSTKLLRTVAMSANIRKLRIAALRTTLLTTRSSTT